jgi:hypothetical protein
MEIKKDVRVLNGEHNGTSFIYEGGLIQMFGRTWDKVDIKTLVEVANLLHLQNFELLDKQPPQKKSKSMFDLWYNSTDSSSEEA